MAECLWCGYEMPWPGGSFCSRSCHENWEAAKALETQAEARLIDGSDVGELGSDWRPRHPVEGRDVPTQASPTSPCEAQDCPEEGTAWQYGLWICPRHIDGSDNKVPGGQGVSMAGFSTAPQDTHSDGSGDAGTMGE
jgi:hypothetical protein